MSKYAVGIDFGTLSARALIVEMGTGREVGTAVMDYPHGVMDEHLPDGTRLEPDWALQHPSDYLDCIRFTVPEAMKRAGVSAEAPELEELGKTLGKYRKEFLSERVVDWTDARNLAKWNQRAIDALADALLRAANE